MIRNIRVRINIGAEEKAFEGRDIDALIADIDSYLVSRK